MNELSISFLTRCFAREETIALLLRRAHPAATTQRIVTLETALASRYRAWLAYENSTGANVYVTANPLHPGSRKRKKESIASIRHLYVDIDIDGDARLDTLRASEIVPPPTSIMSTSPGKYQVLWRVEGFDFARQEQALKLLAIVFGGDPACTDCNRVLRIPGFLNRKYDPPCLVTVEYPDDSIWTPDDFKLDAGAINATLSADTIAARNHPGRHSNSESDWAWVCHELARGKDAVRLTEELASRRHEKPNPLYYAQRTVDIASARLWLKEDVGVDDVIARLESRRRFDLSPSLCSARAREITATAQRMITPKQFT